MSLVNKLFSFGFVYWFALSQALFGMSAAYAQSSPIDVEPPLIEHDVVGTVEAGIRQSFFASVVDDNELDSVSLYYRFQNDPAYSSVLMQRVSYSSTYVVHIPTDAASDRDIEYYIQARDKAGNRTVRGYAFNPLLRTINLAETTPVASTPEPATGAVDSSSGKKKTVLYVVLGVLALGLAASAAGGGGTDDPPSEPCPNGVCTISVTVGLP